MRAADASAIPRGTRLSFALRPRRGRIFRCALHCKTERTGRRPARSRGIANAPEKGPENPAHHSVIRRYSPLRSRQCAHVHGALKRCESFNTRSRSNAMSTLRDTKQAVGDVSDEVAEAARGSADAARTEFSRLGAKLRANGARLEEDLADARERLSDGAKQFGDAAAEQIREHPLAAFGIAFAAGVLLSRLLRSR